MTAGSASKRATRPVMPPCSGPDSADSPVSTQAASDAPVEATIRAA